MPFYEVSFVEISCGHEKKKNKNEFHVFTDDVNYFWGLFVIHFNDASPFREDLYDTQMWKFPRGGETRENEHQNDWCKLTFLCFVTLFKSSHAETSFYTFSLVSD